MSNDLNQCNFIGRLGKSPEVAFMPNGDAVCNFTIAVGEQYKDKQTGQKVENTNWVRVVAFRRLAEIIGEYLNKGSKIYISGKFRERKWQDKDGQDRYTTEIIASNMQMLDSKGDSGGGQYAGQGQGAPSSAPPPQQQAPAPQSQQYGGTPPQQTGAAPPPQGQPQGVHQPAPQQNPSGQHQQTGPPQGQDFGSFEDDIPFN